VIALERFRWWFVRVIGGRAFERTIALSSAAKEYVDVVSRLRDTATSDPERSERLCAARSIRGATKRLWKHCGRTAPLALLYPSLSDRDGDG